MKTGDAIFVVWCENSEKILLVTGDRARAEECAVQHEMGDHRDSMHTF